MNHIALKTHCQLQKQFMEVMGSPTVATSGMTVALGLAEKLIQEEVNLELLPALRKYVANPSLENLTEVFDGVVDSVYVLYQLANALDLPFDAGFDEVHYSNMAKVHPDGTVKRREDGKVLKPEGWKPPNLHSILLDWQTVRQYGQRYMEKGTVA